MMEWIKNHPLMSGGVVLLLIVLIVIFRRGSGGGSQVIQTGPSDALQAAGLQAQVQLASVNAAYAAHISDLNASVAGKNVDAGTALALTSAQKDVALQGIISGADVADTKARSDLFATQYQTQALVQSQKIASDANVKITGIQADAINNQTMAQLAAQGIISKASVDAAVINAGVSNHTTDAALAGLLDTNRTNVIAEKDTNAANVTVAGYSADTAKTLATLSASSEDLKTRTFGNIYTDQIDTQGRNVDNFINSQTSIQEHNGNLVYGLVQSGQLNKGGEGGKNQAGVLETLLGNFGGGTANANQTPDTVGTTAQSFSDIAKSAFSFFSHIF